METHKTLIFVPTYNERDNAPELLRQILALGLDADILFLDDNSPDGTGQILDELAVTHHCLHVIHRTGKLGIGSAHVDGIQWAYSHGYTRLVTMDCDFTHSPADIPRLIEALSGSDVVVGSRWIQGDSLKEWNAFRKFLTGVGHFLTRDLLKVPFDATGAFRVYDLTRIPRHVFTRVTAQGYAFFFESLFLLIRNDYRVCEIPIVLPKRTYGHSKMRIYDALSGAGRIVKLYFATILNPEQFFVPEPFTQLNPHLVDPQNWDEYWEKKKRATSVVYDIIAATYRNLIIKPQLNRFIRKHFAKGSQLLHAGCGSGQVDSQIQREMLITEADISAAALAMCRRHNHWVHQIIQTDIMDLPFPDGSFDGAYNLGVMEHFTKEEIRKILLQLHRVIKPGGKVVIFWPHARATSVLVLNWVHWVLNRILRQNVRLYPAEISLFHSRNEIEPLLREIGFNIVDYYFGPRDMYVQAVLVMEKSLDSNRSLNSSQAAVDSTSSGVNWMGHVETACGAGLLLMVVVFHALMMIHGGALWRDEINTFNMASMSSLGEIVKNLEYDSFPILWFLILRGWISVGMGSAIGLRVLGMLVGIGGTLSLVWACRKLGSRVSLVALVLLGFCPTAYLVGDSLRAYGCGIMLMFLTLVFFWKAVQDPCLKKILPAGLLAILSVQCVYYNSILLFAMGMGGVAVGLRKRDAKKIATALGIGAAAALTLIPYWDVIRRASSWNIMLRIDFTIPWMMAKFREAVEPAGVHIYWIWLALLPIAMAACVWRWFQPSEKTSSQEGDRAMFIFTTLVVAVAGYIVFLKVLSYPTQPWYYLSILAMMAVMMDTAVNLLLETDLAGRMVRLIFVLIIVATTTVNTWNAVHTRRTNIDLLAARLESLATKNDLIVVNGFFYGISFARYYKGDTTWVTVPQLTEYRIHRYDMFKEKMMEEKPLASIHDKIQKTLQAGNLVWVFHWFNSLRDGELPGELPPAPHSRYGWSEGAYATLWSRQTEYLIQQHANKAEFVPFDHQEPVNPYEDVQLLVFQGWHP